MQAVMQKVQMEAQRFVIKICTRKYISMQYNHSKPLKEPVILEIAI